MIADRILALLRDRAGYVVTTWSLVRIAIVTVIGLVVAGLVIPAHPGDLSASPYNAEMQTRNTRNVSLPFGDTRGFQPPNHPKAFRMAWVGGSETMSVGAQHRAYIARLVTDRLGRVDGKRVSTDLYYLDAIRLADELAALSSAVASKPDVLVVSLNPAWVLNDIATQQWGYLDGVLARRSIWPPSRWPVAASLVSPGDVAWKALSRLSPSAIGDRYDRGTALAEDTAGLTLLDAVEGAKPPELTDMQELGQKRPVDFYFGHYLGDDSQLSTMEQQRRLLGREVDSRSSLNRTILRQMFDVARRSGIDTYFYIPPINPEEYAKPSVRADMDELRRQLAEVADGSGDHVHFDPEGLQERVPLTAYKDLVHVRNGAGEADVLAGDLCQLLSSAGHQTECEGR